MPRYSGGDEPQKVHHEGETEATETSDTDAAVDAEDTADDASE